MLSSAALPVAVMGGAFDPVHNAHLRVAIEFVQAFSLAQLRLMPSFQSVHKERSSASAEQRLAMLKLATEHQQTISIDETELLRQGPSYTIDSLQQLRQNLAPQQPLYFAMGSDAFADIQYWKDWQQLFDCANIVVLHRPGVSLDLSEAFLKQRYCRLLPQSQHPAYGRLFELSVSALAISSTQIRQLIAKRQSIDYLVPEAVAHYIHTHQLYLKSL